MSGSTVPGSAPLRPAATVVPLRDSPRGLELLITVRPKSLRFMGGATVFPGGAVSPADTDSRWSEVSTLSPAEAHRLLDESPPSESLALFVCAMREAFEEVGLLVGDGPVERLSRDNARTAEDFLKACLGLGITLRTDLMHPAGRFITPLGSPIRFDARFFAMVVPDGWEPLPDPREVAECSWVAAEHALQDFSEGRAVMAPPTVEMLQILEPHGDSTSALEAFQGSRVGDGSFVLRAPVAPLTDLILAPNPSMMTGPGTNTYVVGAGPRVVIDPAVEHPEYIDEILDAGGEIASILVSHRHPDHVGGVAELVRRTGATVRAFGTEPAGGVEIIPLQDGETLDLAGTTLTTHFTPGHAPDHVCFQMDRWLFAGDNVMGEGTAVISPPEGSMSDFLDSLRKMRELPVEHLLTGHFRPLDDASGVLDRLIEHRLDRERRVVEALDAEPKSIEEIVAAAYSDTPEELHPIAVHSALAHLEMLAEAGRTERLPEGWRLKVVR